jgi:hypothetical protein
MSITNNTTMKRDLLSFFSLILLTAATLAFSACGGANSEADGTALQQNHDDQESMQGMDHDQGSIQAANMAAMDSPSAFKSELGNLYENYETLKDALVATDAEQAALGTTAMQQTLSAIDASGLEDDALSFWKEKAGNMNAALSQMQASQDMETIRKGFADLTAPMHEVIATFGANSRILFVQHCPMAFNNAGASWISDEKQIRNPYFGNKMLRCGSIEATIDLP